MRVLLHKSRATGYSTALFDNTSTCSTATARNLINKYGITDLFVFDYHIVFRTQTPVPIDGLCGPGSLLDIKPENTFKVIHDMEFMLFLYETDPAARHAIMYMLENGYASEMTNPAVMAVVLGQHDNNS